MLRLEAILSALLMMWSGGDARREIPRPREGLLPGKRVVTFYGNPLSTKMGILGEIPPDQMVAKLEEEAQVWRRADPSTPVMPGLELIATVASDQPGPDGKYRSRMPAELIERVIGWARRRHWIIILDVQVGRSDVRTEIQRLRPYLERPDVHLALDPEFQMRRGLRPGQRIGRSDAEDVNIALDFLAGIVEKRSLPRKLLLVHRFTGGMLTRAWRIRRDPRVDVAIIMDGFGAPTFKRFAYRVAIAREPVAFAGIKLFYKNDRPMLTPKETLDLRPLPRVVIYQ